MIINHKLTFVFFCILITGCSPQSSTSQKNHTPNPSRTPQIVAATQTASGQPQPTTSPTFPAPDLDQQPLYWFAPLPPMPTGTGRPFIGSEDFMGLFNSNAPWDSAAGYLQVFKLYGEWVAYHATDAQLSQAISDIRRRGLALAVEAGPLNAPPECGEGVEGFAGTVEGQIIAERIQNAGGKIDIIALDEPYFFGHFYDGPNACNWSDVEIAEGVDEFIRFMRGFFPDILIGDTEPLAGPTTAADYTDWLLTFREVSGYDLAFLHMDIDWSRVTWPEEIKQIEEFGRQEGIPIGLIYTGNFGDTDDETWLSISGERVKRYEIDTAGNLAHILFQSWHDHPDLVLPETEAYTFTNFILSYFEAPESLGFRNEGLAANLAFGRPVRASRIASGFDPALAVDGDTGTLWSAGDFTTQWIEVNLESPRNILEIRLIPSQYPAGNTVHRVFGKGPATSNQFVLLHTFQDYTEDSQLLVFTPDEPWEGYDVIRIETILSPSWVAWREIQIIDAGD